QSHSSMECGALNCAGFNAESLQGILSSSLGLGWTSPSNAFDMSFGLSWLDGRSHTTGFLPASAPGQFDLTYLDGGAAVPFNLESAHSLQARATWRPEQGPLFDLTAGLSQGQFSSVWYGLSGSGLDLSQAS